MNRKVIVLNLCLLALAGWLFWMLRLKWVELHVHAHNELSSSPQIRQRNPLPPVPLSGPIAASAYNEVAQKDLFAKDRNPNVIVEVKPVPAPPPPPPMPPLPAYYGIMAFGDPPVVVLKLPKGEQRNYHAGEKVGPFELVSFDRDKIVFDWDGKIVERKPDDLRDKDSTTKEVVAATPAAVPAASPAANVRTTSSAAAEELKGSDKFGLAEGDVKLCNPKDTSPSGTIEGDYRKKVLAGPFGTTCTWELVK